MRLHEIIRNPLKTPPSVPSQQHLYHGTQLYSLALILQSNRLDEGVHWRKPGEPHGVRTTRNLEAAKSFAFEQEHPGGILVLNWPKLAQSYKIISYADTQYNDVDRSQPGEPWESDEAEEAVLTAAIKPLSGYLEAILMRPEELKELQSGAFLTPEAIGWFREWLRTPPKLIRSAIQLLMDYPRLSSI